jgi:hypothetical protein
MFNVWFLTVRRYVDFRLQASGVCRAQPHR